MTVIFEGPEEVDVFRAITLKHGLKLYASVGIKPNRDWTPTAMLRTAGKITGHTYKRGQYAKAIEDLETWINLSRSL